MHRSCREFLAGHGYRFVAEHSPEESFSFDGLIVARSPLLPPLEIPIQKRV
jgi:hypothetical protein